MKFYKNIKLGGQGCQPYGVRKENITYMKTFKPQSALAYY